MCWTAIILGTQKDNSLKSNSLAEKKIGKRNDFQNGIQNVKKVVQILIKSCLEKTFTLSVPALVVVVGKSFGG